MAKIRWTEIEELIRKESAPRRLTVVSSDHRVQRAARRRKAMRSTPWSGRRSRTEMYSPMSSCVRAR